ncbi:MAG: Crp/Fnr family transcriptional regulator [Bacteroidaceae bacterium]|nr:Crp/Fnr family transcriptional regulator [Bacteroidaceae bacterium]
MDIAQSMRAIYPIKDLTIERFVQSLERVKYSKGTRIIEQGNKSSYLYLIIDGVIRCLHEDGEKETSILFGVEGNFFVSLASIVYGQPSQTSFEAISDVEVYRISFDDFWALCDEYPDLMRWQSHYQLYQLYTLEKRSTLTSIGDAYTRYQQYIKMRGKRTIAQIPLKYISQYLNISQETLSRIRSRIARGE